MIGVMHQCGEASETYNHTAFVYVNLLWSIVHKHMMFTLPIVCEICFPLIHSTNSNS